MRCDSGLGRPGSGKRPGSGTGTCAVAAGSAVATVLAGKAGIRATYLAMAVSAAVIAVAVGPPLVRRAGLR
jgi:hypothetical protein